MQAQAATYQSESLLFSILLQLAAIVVAARLANIGLRRLEQPGAVRRRRGQLIPHVIEA